MKMTGEEIIAAPRQVVWDALNDPEILKQSITGCEEIKKKSDTEFEARVTAKVGPVKASFMGNVKLSKLNAPRSYVISGEGKGGVAGFAKGGATVQLSDTANGQTKLSYDVDAQVGGKLAQIGSRLIDSSAKKMAADFFKKFNKIVSERVKDMAVEKVFKPAAKKTAAKKADAADASKASAKASKPAAKAASAATGKAASKTAAKTATAKAKPAVKSAKVAAKSTAGATKAAAKSAAKTAKAATKPAASKTSAAAKTAKSSARKAAERASVAVEATASQTASAADAAASKARDAASSVASAAKQPVSKASEAMPPQAQAMSRLWIWVVLAAVAGLVVVWATGGSGGQ